MVNQERTVKTLALVLLILTILWVVLTGISMSRVKSSWTPHDFMKWISDPDIIFVLNYINATLLTVVAVLLFSSLFVYLKTEGETAALAGLVFVPIYGLMNLFCYSIQISVVPSIVRTVLDHSGPGYMAFQFIQASPDSLTGFINGLAYGILGIPSIIYGRLLFRKSKKYSGTFLAMNGIFCLLGIIGYLTGNPIMSKGTLIGGILFLISLAFMVVEFRKRGDRP